MGNSQTDREEVGRPKVEDEKAKVLPSHRQFAESSRFELKSLDSSS